MKELNTIDIIFLLLKVTFSVLQLVPIFSQGTLLEMHNFFIRKPLFCVNLNFVKIIL